MVGHMRYAMRRQYYLADASYRLLNDNLGPASHFWSARSGAKAALWNPGMVCNLHWVNYSQLPDYAPAVCGENDNMSSRSFLKPEL